VGNTAEITSQEIERLIREATEAAERAYAPYSNFRVGAVVLGKAGIYHGVNVENASSGLTICAERSALAAALTAGDREILAIAIACIDAPLEDSLGQKMPCGACRQWIAELAPKALIYVRDNPRPFTIEDLLPNAFRLH
jgi:cytidine deaminase